MKHISRKQDWNQGSSDSKQTLWNGMLLFQAVILVTVSNIDPNSSFWWLYFPFQWSRIPRLLFSHTLRVWTEWKMPWVKHGDKRHCLFLYCAVKNNYSQFASMLAHYSKDHSLMQPIRDPDFSEDLTKTGCYLIPELQFQAHRTPGLYKGLSGDNPTPSGSATMIVSRPPHSCPLRPTDEGTTKMEDCSFSLTFSSCNFAFKINILKKW